MEINRKKFNIQMYTSQQRLMLTQAIPDSEKAEHQEVRIVTVVTIETTLSYTLPRPSPAMPFPSLGTALRWLM